MTESISFPLAQLTQSPINVRAGDDDVADLVASIRAHGLLQPLIGRSRGEDLMIEIIDGGRRLRALQTMREAGDAIDEIPVMLRDDGDATQAYELSLAANVMRKNLHPVVEFEAFAALADQGRAIEDIAAHFGVEDRAVRQRLALGRLHPDIRNAWREGRISGAAAQAFTIADPQAQADYLRDAAADWQLRPDRIRDALSHDLVDGDDRRVIFVGLDAYLAAGGALAPDLFADPPALADSGLLERLAQEKLSAEAERIKTDEGWGEVVYGKAAENRYAWDRIPHPALPDESRPPRLVEIDARLAEIDVRWNWIETRIEKIEVTQGKIAAAGRPGGKDRIADLENEVSDLRTEFDCLSDEGDTLDKEKETLSEAAAWMTLTPEARAAAIAVIEIGNLGALQVSRGYLREKRKAQPTPSPLAAPPAAKAADAPEPVALSAALHLDLAQTATRAAAFTLAQEPRIAMAALLAAEVTRGAPVRLTRQGRGEGPPSLLPDRHDDQAMEFEAAFRTLLKLSADELQHAIAGYVARALDFAPKVGNYQEPLRPQAVQDLRCALPLQPHRAALVQAFNAEAYFLAAPRAEAIAAIAECGDEPAKSAKLKKPDLAAVAARLATARGWLPPLLRGEIFTPTDAALVAQPVDSVPSESPPADGTAAADAPPETAAQAADRIWREAEPDAAADAEDAPLVTPDELRAEIAAMSMARLRAELKEQKITALRHATRGEMNELLVQALTPKAAQAEAAE